MHEHLRKTLFLLRYSVVSADPTGGPKVRRQNFGGSHVEILVSTGLRALPLVWESAIIARGADRIVQAKSRDNHGADDSGIECEIGN